MKFTILALIVALASTTTLIAQTAAAEEDGVASLTRHARVQVHMEGGGVINGVVRDGHFVERRTRTDFEVMDEDQRTRFDAGIRVWFYDGLPGYIFLHYRDIAGVRTIRPVTASEMKKLEARRVAWESAEGVLRPIERSEDPNPEVYAPPTFSRPPATGAEHLDAEQSSLIERFPPAAGWTPERYATLQRDVVLAAREMTASEDAWTRVYPEWLRAYRIFNGIEESKAAPASTAKSPEIMVSPTPIPTPRAASKPRSSRPSPKVAEKPGRGVDIKSLGADLLRSLGAGKSPAGGGAKRGVSRGR